MKNLLMSSLLILFIYPFDVDAHDKDLSILLKGGSANYNASIGNFGGGGHSYYEWKLGPQFSIGIEKELSSTFSIQALFVYSIHSFDERYAWGDKVNNAKNSIYDLMGNLKLNIGIFYFNGGIGFSYQSGEEVRYLEANQYHGAETKLSAINTFVFAGLLGIGFDINVYKQFSLITEADINLREYMGTALLIGIKYSL